MCPLDGLYTILPSLCLSVQLLTRWLLTAGQITWCQLNPLFMIDRSIDQSINSLNYVWSLATGSPLIGDILNIMSLNSSLGVEKRKALHVKLTQNWIEQRQTAAGRVDLQSRTILQWIRNAFLCSFIIEPNFCSAICLYELKSFFSV